MQPLLRRTAPVWLFIVLSGGGSLCAQSLTGLVFIESTTDADIGFLADGAVYDVSALGSVTFNVRAETNPTTVGSVRFGLDGDPDYRTENTAPYALQGDVAGDYNDWIPSLGSHTIEATAYSGANATGTAGPTLSITFTLVNQGGGPSGNFDPLVSAGPARFAVDPDTSVVLQGSASDFDGDISSLSWTQVSGPPATIQTPTELSTSVTGITLGSTSRFRFTATDDQGGTASSDVWVAGIPSNPLSGAVSGEPRAWHRLSVDFVGPSSSEAATPNPFLDHRLDVVFTNGLRSIVVPGFYCADGNAAESSADTGSIWRVHFAPDETGIWSYTALFRSGPEVAVAEDPGVGTPDFSVFGAQGMITVLPTDKTAPDHRGEGLLEYVGEHYLRFRESGRSFIKGGADSPENFLGYEDFDGTYDVQGTFLHAYAPHAGDWNPGDPEWGAGQGREIIGALNYLSGKGMNSVFFLTMNVDGDGQDVWPWTSHTERVRYDCSKLDQWEIVFEHMDRVGIQLHAVLQETENDQLLDGGALGVQRRLYHRELIARFSHHLALAWNLGEENTNTHAQRVEFSQHIRDLDPYDHPVSVHTGIATHQQVYQPLLGFEAFEGPSLLGALDTVHPETQLWVSSSRAAGRPWIVCNDENGPPGSGVIPDANDFWHDDIRHRALWGNLMAGGAGSEWYFGFNFPNGDRDCEDWRSRDNLWNITRHALEFFHEHLPFWSMESSDGLTTNPDDYCFSLLGEVYAAYLPNGGTTGLQIAAGTYTVEWFDPRNGGPLQTGTITSVTGPGTTSLGSPPAQPTDDWVVLVRAIDSEFIRGDCNTDGIVNVADVVRQLDGIFVNASLMNCRDACDTNDDGFIQISDPITTLAALFYGGSIPAPIQMCGVDPTPDGLGCGASGGCP